MKMLYAVELIVFSINSIRKVLVSAKIWINEIQRSEFVKLKQKSLHRDHPFPLVTLNCASVGVNYFGKFLLKFL